ncbi:MAG: thiaminase II [Gammaproteobacteria bacterium]|jgi:thiaminase/transcriptional activator TenA
MTTFSERAWEATGGLYRRILDLPFNSELVAGTLSQERFRFYMIQDALYLAEYARALAVCAAKAPDMEDIRFYAKAAETVVVVERALHGGFFEKFGISPADAAAAEPSPTCFGYTNFLLAVALKGGYAELTAAVLPCFRIYWEVGNHIAAVAKPGNPYQAWIDTYANPDFGDAVKTAESIADKTEASASEADAAAMMRAYRRCAQFEWMFWDSAYRREAWPAAAD